MPAHIASLGVKLPDAEEFEFHKPTKSLADADLVVVSLGANVFANFDRTPQVDRAAGMLKFDSETTYEAMRRLAWWRGELTECLVGGKTVVVMVERLDARRTADRHVMWNVEALPQVGTGQWPVVEKDGSRISIDPGAKLFSAFWRAFEDSMTYGCAFEKVIGQPIFWTLNEPKRPVGLHVATRSGNLMLLPHVARGDKDVQLVQHLAAIHKEIRSDKTPTPPPAWAAGAGYLLEREAECMRELDGFQAEMDRLAGEAAARRSELSELGVLRGLLYETGSPLERSIIKALTILGFAAENFRQGDSEFDVVFQSAEGRLLGEAEGKENRAVNIDKARQLTMNIFEDQARDDVHAPAKGVLFSNAYRLIPPAERTEWFTPKCISAAVAQSIALVRTSDLFNVAKYLAEHDDPAHSKACRLAMLEEVGEVKLPPLPQPTA